METRIALIGIIVDDMNATEQLNQILHAYGDYVVGRMGIPYRKKGYVLSVLLLMLLNTVISSLSGKLGCSRESLLRQFTQNGEYRMKLDQSLTKQQLVSLLAWEDFSEVYEVADTLRKERKGDWIDIRAILEFSNYCRCQCRYCGLNCRNRHLKRYRLSPEQIVETCREAANAGYRTVVLQSGEDRWYTPKLLGDIIRRVKETGMAVTVSCGEFSDEDYAYFRECGADRYLIKHETANEKIYAQLHPGTSLKERVRCLKTIKRLGYETGSGFMIGLPGQTLETVAEDLLLLKEIGCDMAGIGRLSLILILI